MRRVMNLFKKENNPAVQKLTRRTTAASRSRNIYVIAAIALTTLLISFVFSIGMSYLKSSELQQIRLMGTTAHAAVTNPTDEQVKKLKTLPYVKTVGLQYNTALIENTPKMSSMTLTLHWYDKTEWREFHVPAASHITGRYPEKYNEIMVPLWVLHNMGINNPQIGMKIPLNFFLGDERKVSQRKIFVLSGYYTEYMYIRSGNTDSILVSEEFAQKSGNCVQKNGAVSVAYKDKTHINQYNEQLVQDLSLTKDQKVKTVPMYEKRETGSSAAAFAFAAVIIFLMATGYLLIYNVLYISVSKDIRFYGLLKTIGAAPGQLKKIVISQALHLASIGIPIGLAAGAILSFAVVPMALGMFNMETGAEVSFSPVIFLGAVFFALMTTLIGAAKPARIAAKISPLEALRFTGVYTQRKQKHSQNGGKLYRMAWRNIFRNRKRASVVFVSLFSGITAFMVVITLVYSMDTDNYIASYVKNDFILKNNTMETVGTNNVSKQKFDTEFLSQLKKIKGITNLRTTTMEEMTMKYNERQFANHMNWFCKKFHVKKKLSDQEIRDNFTGLIIGLDSRYIEELNKSSKTPVNLAAFKHGEIALIGADDPTLYSGVGVMDVTLSSTGKTLKIPLGGFVPLGFQYAGGGMAPNIYVSEEALQKLVPDAKIYKVNIDVKDGLKQYALKKSRRLQAAIMRFHGHPDSNNRRPCQIPSS